MIDGNLAMADQQVWADKATHEAYEPFGEAWEKEIRKNSKDVIIRMLRLACEEHSLCRQRMDMAKSVLVDLYFKPNEVSDDIAPRILEYVYHLKGLQQRWIPVAEQEPPKDWRDIQVCTLGDISQSVLTIRWYETEWRLPFSEVVHDGKFTHWRFLPSHVSKIEKI